MNEFRRPLGVLVLSILAGVVGYITMGASDSITAESIGMLLAGTAWIVGLVTVGVIGLRLVRRRPTA